MESGEKSLHIVRHWRGDGDVFTGNGVNQGKRGGMEGRPGNQVRIFGAIEPVTGEGAADGGHMNAELMSPACFRAEPQEGERPMDFQNLIMGNGRRTVRTDHPGDGGLWIPADGRVNGSGIRRWTPHADGPVFPPEVRGMEASAEQFMDVAALCNDHQTGSPLVQTADGMKDKVRPPRPGQGPGDGRGIGQEIGGMRGHSGGLVDDHKVFVFPEDGQGPGTGGDSGTGRAAVSGLDIETVASMKNEGCMNRQAVDENAVGNADQPGDGVGGEMEPGPKDMADGSPGVFRGNGVRNDSIGFHKKIRK